MHSPKQKLFTILISPPRFSNRDLISAESPNSKSSGFFKGLSKKFVETGSVVFRFDNRGVGLSGGSNESITIFSHANDVKKIVDYFKSNKEFKDHKFCLVGYSEGGAVSQVVASQLNEIDFLILLSSSGYGGWEFFKYQTKRYYEIRGSMYGVETMTDSLFRANEIVQLSLYDTLNKYTDYKTIERQVSKYVNAKLLSDDLDILSKPHYKLVFDNMVNSWISPQQIELKKFQPEKFLSKIKCPVLALNGTRDDLVECDKNLNAIKLAVLQGGNNKITTVAIPNVNHNYRTLQEGSIWNLADRDEVFSNEAFEAISNWLSGNYSQ